jgi:translation elongation factor EF-Ts
MIAELMGEPLELRPWEILRLTDRQIVDLYHHARDREGRVVRKRGARVEAKTPEQAKKAAEAIAAMFGLKINPDGTARAASRNETTYERRD